MKPKLLLMLLAAALAILTAPAQAATMSSSATAPAVDGKDIASYGTQNGSDKWWVGPAGAHGNPGRTIGQTFTTGSEDVLLNAFTFQVRSNSEPTKGYTIRVGTISDTTFTEIYTETAVQDFSTAADDFWTWTLGKPVVLSANTLYGVDVGLNSSTSDWTTGIPYVYRTADEYPDGTRFRSGSEGYGIGNDTLDNVGGDRIFHIDLSILGASNPSPENGATVPAGNVELSWTNADPNDPGDSVYVNVWFGTEPNELHPGYDMTKVVIEGQDRTTVTVSASTEGTYYWRVDSYISGADHINEPNRIEGPMWTFNTVSDQPPTIDDMGADMITWSGQAVQLDATVTDDGVSDLTYAWSAFPADGVVFSPSADIEDPTVTITKDVGVAVIGLPNCGFEDPRDDPCDIPDLGFVPFPDGDRDYTGHLRAYLWTYPNWSYYYNGYSGVYNPVAGDYNSGEAPEGQNVGFVQSYSADDDPYYTHRGGLAHGINTYPDPNTRYTLSVEVGNPLYNDAFPGYRVQLLAGGAVLAQDANSLVVPPGEFVTSTVVYDSGETPPQQKLGVRLMVIGDPFAEPDAGLNYEVHFDDVKLVSNGKAAVALTLAVHDESNPTPVEDTMTIDVYDTACLAARIGLGLAAENPTDFDENCITDLRDFAVLATAFPVDSDLKKLAAMAATWLVDYELTAPVPKP